MDLSYSNADDIVEFTSDLTYNVDQHDRQCWQMHNVNVENESCVIRQSVIVKKAWFETTVVWYP